MSEYFSGNPIRLDVSRSKYHVSPRWTGSWKIGELVPIFATSLILPGDTFKMRISSAVRTITPIVPVMDDMDMSIECYFVPHHLVLSRQYMSPNLNDSNVSWSAFIGAQDSLLNMPLPSNNVKLPYLQLKQSDYVVGGLADCLGYTFTPGNTGGVTSVNPLKALAYYSIWNEYWRDPSTWSPVTFSISGSNIVFTGSDAGVSTYSFTDYPCAPVCRYHGYFGSALPWPQRNSTAVTLPLGATAPVITTTTKHDMGEDLFFGHVGSGGTIQAITSALGMTSGVVHAYGSTGTSIGNIDASNLYADLSTATAATINQVRLMFQTQRWYEQLARSGNREGEVTYGMFGVRGNDEGLRRPEYLGGKRIPISQTQVPSTGNGTTSSASTASLGTNGAFSLTNDSDYYFTKSFTTWGTLMVVMVCRPKTSLSCGIDRENFVFDRFDMYWPQFANIGEQPIYRRELMNIGATESVDKAVFGYQEAWAEYRMFNDHVTGQLRVGQSLDMMTYATGFYGSGYPTLKGFLNAANQYLDVDRTLQVGQETAEYTFYGQFQFDIDMVRPMPLYSIPGLIDHH